MRVHLYPADGGACGSLRMAWPAAAARRAGFDVTVFEPGPMEDFPLRISYDLASNSAKVLVLREPDFDVVVFQRPLNFRVPVAIMALKQLGIRCVVEIDDDLGTVDRQHVVWASLQPSSMNFESNHQHLANACALADTVVVTTPRLAQRYGRHNAVVVENHIPAAYLDAAAERDPDQFVIGWTGRVRTHPGDLLVTRGALQRVIDSTGATFRVMADGVGVKREAGLKNDPDVTGGVRLADYAPAVAEYDVGIAPLARSAFNMSKSWLKPLDYAATGVPFVCSDVPEYRRFVEQGCGLLAGSRHDWEKHLVRLHKSPALRAEQAAAGREVASRWTIEEHYLKFVEAWCGAIPIVDVAAVREDDRSVVPNEGSG